jgi:hypothetical protein
MSESDYERWCKIIAVTPSANNVTKLANQTQLAKASETVAQVVLPDTAENIIARAYMRLQCADVPRELWHWEVCQILGSPRTTAETSATKEAGL